MPRRSTLYTGGTKTLFSGPEPDTLVLHFRDDARPADAPGTDDGAAAQHHAQLHVGGKGVVNCLVSEFLLTRLHEMGIPSHLMRRVNLREHVVREAETIPLRLMVRNVAAGSLARRLGLEAGAPLPRSIVEYFYKPPPGTRTGAEPGAQSGAQSGANAAPDGPTLVSEEHITAFGWAGPQDIDDMLSTALRVNDYLSGLFAGVGVRLADVSLEFGRLYDENGDVRVVLVDEISPDTCRLRDRADGAPLGRESPLASRASGAEAWRDIARRLSILPDGGPA